MAIDPSEMLSPRPRGQSREVAAQNPDWAEEDVRAKAEALIQVDVDAARAVLLENGDWDGGLPTCPIR